MVQKNNLSDNLFSPNELSRKIVHFLICLGLFLFAHLVDWTSGVLIAMFGVFVTFLLDKNGYLSYFQRVKRSSKGHYWMFFGILITFLMYKHVVSDTGSNHLADVSLAFALMSLGMADPLSMFGRPIFNYFNNFSWFSSWAKYLTFERKTFTGTLIYVASSLLIAALIKNFFGVHINAQQDLKLLAGVIVIGVIEFFSIWGFDNLFIPVLSFLLMWNVIN